MFVLRCRSCYSRRRRRPGRKLGQYFRSRYGKSTFFPVGFPSGFFIHARILAEFYCAQCVDLIPFPTGKVTRIQSRVTPTLALILTFLEPDSDCKYHLRVVQAEVLFPNPFNTLLKSPFIQ